MTRKKPSREPITREECLAAGVDSSCVVAAICEPYDYADGGNGLSPEEFEGADVDQSWFERNGIVVPNE